MDVSVPPADAAQRVSEEQRTIRLQQIEIGRQAAELNTQAILPHVQQRAFDLASSGGAGR